MVAQQRDAAAAQSIQSSITNNHLMSDDFIDRYGVQKQLDDLVDYVLTRRQEEPDYCLPRPSGWRIQVLMLTIPRVSKGGVEIIDEAREQRSLASPQGVIIAMGPAAYTDPARFSVDGVLTPWHRVGDRISFVKYDAQMFQLANGQRLGLLTDTQPLSTIDSGWGEVR